MLQPNDAQVKTIDLETENEAARANCVPSQIDEVSAHLLSVSPSLVPEVSAAHLAANCDQGHFGATIGATDPRTDDVLFPDIAEDLSGCEIGSNDFDEIFPNYESALRWTHSNATTPTDNRMLRYNRIDDEV
jgi:hypothetical protein